MRRAWKFAVAALNVDAPLICEGKYGDIQSQKLSQKKRCLKQNLKDE